MFLAAIIGFFVSMPLLGSVIGRLLANTPQSAQAVAGFAVLYFAGVIAANIIALWFRKQEKQEN